MFVEQPGYSESVKYYHYCANTLENFLFLEWVVSYFQLKGESQESLLICMGKGPCVPQLYCNIGKGLLDNRI